MNGYKAFYNGKTVEVHAATILAARDLAAEKLKVPAKKRYLVAIVLCEKDGRTVAHSTTEL
jgi:hypothetical protein